MKKYQSNRKTTGGRIMTKKAATGGGMSRAKGHGTFREKSLNSDNVHIENQRLLALVIFHH